MLFFTVMWFYILRLEMFWYYDIILYQKVSFGVECWYLCHEIEITKRDLVFELRSLMVLLI